MHTMYLANTSLLERLSEAPWWWSLLAGLLMVGVAFGIIALNKRVSKDDDDSDTSCLLGFIALMFGAAGVLAIASGLFGW